MARFAQPEDLQLFLSLEAPADDAKLTQCVELASAAVQAYCRQRIERVEDDEVTLSGERDLVLSERPMVSVASIALIDRIGQEISLDPALYRWNSKGEPLFRNTFGRSQMRVVYTHGYETIPEEVKLATLKVAKRLFLGQDGEIASLQIGPTYQEEQTGAVPAKLVDSERNLLKDYRRTITSVEVG